MAQQAHALEVAGSDTEIWLIVADAKWSNQGALAAYGVWGEGWVVGYYCWGVKSKGHSLYGDEKGMKVAPRPSQMIHSLPWPLMPGLTSLLFSLLTVYCRAPLARRVQVYPIHGKDTVANHVFTCSFTNIRVCRHTHVCLIHGCTLIKHVCKCQMSKVHCGTLLTSNMTNNFFLQLHCSNPFSGFWNGNIITFLWCSAFDKTAACWAECLTELDASPKPSPLSTLLLSLTHSTPSLLLPFLLSPPIALSVISKNSFCLSLSLSPAQVLQWIKEVLSTSLMAPPFRRLMREVCSPPWLAQMDWCRRSH